VMAARSAKPTPIPWKATIMVGVVMLCDNMALYQIIPYAPFLVKKFLGIPDTEKGRIGYYAGLITSAYAFAQLLSSFPIGSLSDRFGRRAVIVGGMIGTTIATFAFGFAKSFWFALLTRAFNGLVNGNAGVVKTYLAQCTDNTNKARAFAVFGIAGGLGRIIGPLIGGTLQEPSASYPKLFPKGSFFDTFPYMLPCLASMVFTITGLILAFLFVKEPKPRTTSVEIEMEETLIINEDDIDNSSSESGDEDSNSDVGVPRDDVKPPGFFRSLSKNCTAFDMNVISNRTVWLATSMYGLIAFQSIVFDEVFSLLILGPPEQGGLNFDAKRIGICISAAGGCVMVYQLCIYPHIVKYLGPLKSMRIAQFSVGIVMLIFPFVGLLHKNVVLSWIAVIALMILRYLFVITVYTCTFVLIANCIEETKLGAVNGIGQSLASFARGVGPTLGATLFAWSQTWNIHIWPLDFHFVHVMIAVVAFINFTNTFFLPKGIESTFVSHSSASDYSAAQTASPLQSDDNEYHSDNITLDGEDEDDRLVPLEHMS